MNRPKVLLADDHVILREGILHLLEHEFEVIGTASDGRVLVETAERLQPDVVVLDVSMPVMSGIEAARRLRRATGEVKIVFLTQQSSKPYVREAFLAGASAYVLKQSAAAELLPALHEALEGRYYVSCAIAEAMPGLKPGHLNPAEFAGELTPRQREFLDLMVTGTTVEEIAAHLGITVKTAEFHFDTIMNELGLRTKDDLKRYGATRGVQLGDAASDRTRSRGSGETA